MTASRPESTLWNHVRPRLLAAAKDCDLPIYLTRVENTVNNGHPDVEFIIGGKAGTIELKVAKEWPKRPDTPLRLRHYTQEQKEDARARHIAGGRPFLLLEVSDTFMLSRAPWSLLVGSKERAVLERICDAKWEGEINGRELLAALMGD